MSDNYYSGKLVLVRNIKIKCTFDNSIVLDTLAVNKAKKLISKSCICGAVDANSAFIYKKSIDARIKNCIFLIYTVAFRTISEHIDDTLLRSSIFSVCTVEQPNFSCNKTVNAPPLVVGFGPSGMFCALALAKAGLNPIVIERGSDVDVRAEKVNKYWRDGILDCQTNVQFGEGGAGTFSDGKLLTRISDSFCHYVLNEFVKHGAPSEILYLSKPHIGTDNLRVVVKNIRNEIIRLGGKVLFNQKLTSLNKNPFGRITSAVVNDNLTIDCSSVFLCVGHSARDTFNDLMECGVGLFPKPFSVGVRIEHLQSKIDGALYGDFAGCDSLGPASYTLSTKVGSRAVYSFCMCPGGTVVASASGDGQIVTNGMSYYARDGKNANSALAVSVDLSDFGGTVRGAIEFQEHIENTAFRLAGCDGTAPIQLLGDFLNDKVVTEPNDIMPTYTGKTSLCSARNVFPPFITDSLSSAVAKFDREIAGFSCENAVLTFPETRTSSPVRIPREQNYRAVGFENLYPCGEGAGYAGGITSAAVDGLRSALSYINE